MSKLTKWFYSVLIGFFLLLFTLHWMKSDFLLGEEYGIMGEILHLRYLTISKIGWLTKQREERVRETLTDYLFIDMSNNNALVYSDGTNKVRVDRQALANVFRELHKEEKKIRMVLCDILLLDTVDAHWGQNPEQLDETQIEVLEGKAARINKSLRDMLDSFQQKDKILLPQIYDSESRSKIGLAYNEIKTGIAQYKFQFNNSFYRYNYITDGHRGVPIMMWDKLSSGKDTSYTKSFLGLSLLGGNSHRNGGITLNRIIPHFRITQDEIVKDKDYFTASEFRKELIADHSKPLIVVIGNFETRDIHTTIFEKLTGPLLLVNLYEGIRHGDNFFEWWFILLTLGVYIYIGYNSINRLIFKEKHLHFPLPVRQCVRISWGKKHIAWLSNIVSFIFCFSQYILFFLKYHFREHWVHILLVFYTVFSLIFFNHYLYLLAAVFGLILLNFIIGLVRYFRAMNQVSYKK